MEKNGRIDPESETAKELEKQDGMIKQAVLQPKPESKKEQA